MSANQLSSLPQEHLKAVGAPCRVMCHRSLLPAVFVVLAPLVRAADASAANGRAPGAHPVVVRITEGGFSWGDAAIGAAAAVGLIAIVGGLALAVGRGLLGTNRHHQGGSR